MVRVMEDWFDESCQRTESLDEAIENLMEQKCGLIAVIENGYCVEKILYDVFEFEA